ncbi:hypothetical protein [Parafrankia sp. FMc2]|uniref:hypothetical protein n=1 Tax=Parafrankia sp. FMc2 TaxID=3233196 RepID=UPI0034D49FC0
MDRPARGGAGGHGRSGPARDGAAPRRRPPAPPLPDKARAELLDRDIRRDLRSVPAPLAETIARHLVAAAMLVDEDPALALEHARAAAARLPRMAAVREAVGVAAYHAGEYAAALLELRAARRIDGSPHNLPLIADSERGLGRPERAVDCLSDPGAAELDAAGRIELLIVVSGARRDMGQPEAAAVLLREHATARTEPRPWTPRLWYAYAEALLASGRPVEALRWFTATAGIDEDETDAAERIYELTVIDDDDDDDADGADDASADATDAGTDGVERAASIRGTEAEAAPTDVAETAVAEAVAAGAEAAGRTPTEPRVTGSGDAGAAADESGRTAAGEPVAAARAESAPAGVDVSAGERAAEAGSAEGEVPGDALSQDAATGEAESAERVARPALEGPVDESAHAGESAGESAPGADEATPAVSEAAVDFSAAGEGTAATAAADSAAPIPEIIFSDAPDGGEQSAAPSRAQDQPPA